MWREVIWNNKNLPIMKPSQKNKGRFYNIPELYHARREN